MDCSVVTTAQEGQYLISTTDYFSPLIDDPYLQGRVAACNVLSDLYAMGVNHVDTVLMVMGVCSEMEPSARDIVVPKMIRGFTDLCHEAGTSVTGGQTTFNPWPLVGGMASVVLREEEFIRPQVQPGDVLVLTKPLGTQITVNLMEWMTRAPEWWAKVKDVITEEQVLKAFNRGVMSMARLNHIGAKLMQKHKAHGGTDITGFGILGHADNLAKASPHKVDIVIDALPAIKWTVGVDAAVGDMFKLKEGYSAETSGGLFVALPSEEAADAFIADIVAEEGRPAWRVGRVIEGSGKATMAADLKIIEVL